MWQVFYGDTLIGDPRLDLPIYDKDLEVELNTTGKFEFTLGDSHPMNGKLVKYQKRDEVKVFQDGDIVFCGRIVEAEQSFDRSTRYTCEGDRGYLNDAIVKPYKTGIENVPDTAHGYFTWLVAQYNDSMDPGTHFTIGINQGSQIYTKVERSQTADTKVWAEMKAVLVDDFGCYIRTRRVGSMRYIDLLVEGDKTAMQRIRFGENLMDFSHRTGGEEYYTRVFARGGNYGDAAADKSALEQLVAEAQQIPKGDKSDSAKDTLDGAILKARVVLYDTSATQSEADAELSQLQDAIRKFYSSTDKHDSPDTRIGDKTQLQATYNYVAGLDRTGLSERTKASLIAALTVAAEVLANQGATQSHVNAAQSALDSATNGIRAEGDDTVTLERMSDRGLLNGYALHGGWVVNEAAERELGVIEGTFTDETCTDDESLLASALRHLINVRIGDAIEMTAVDLHNVDPSVRPIRVGDYVRATSRPHGFDEYFICTSRKYDLDHPENDKFSLGSEYDTLTGAQSKKLIELNAGINSAVDQVDAATALAGSKAAIFSSQPSVYMKNDLWVQAPAGDDEHATFNIMVATSDSDGTFDASDWERASDYTNDQAVLHLGEVYANYVEAKEAVFNSLTADTAKIHDLTADQLNVTVGYIEDLTAENITVTDLTATHAYIEDLEAENITAQDLSAAHAYIADLEADNITAQNLIADHAEVGSLDANYAQIDLANIANGTIKSAMIDDAQITNAKIANGTIENAKIKDGTIETAKIKDAAIDTAKIKDAAISTAKIAAAAIGTAQISNAAITNALIANEAVSSSQILSVSANKLTAGTINAAEIDVTNLHASSLIVDKLNGQPVLGGYTYVNKNISGYSSKNPSQEGWYEMTANGFALSTDTSVDSTKAYYTQGNPTKLYDQDYIDGLEEGLNQRIDGAIETFTGDHVPTLNTYPAVDWTTDDAKSAHVGDIYFVTNDALNEDGYNYRFAYDNTRQQYMWVLIKDSDVTKALQDITDLQDFESETTSWIEETDQGITTIRQNHTTLSGVVDKTVKSSTQLWYTKADTTAPGKPTSQVTSTSTAGNAWRTVVPAWNASYPNYYYCWQYKLADNTYAWSDVVRDIAMGESQGTARDAKTEADANIKSSVQLWYTKANSTAPSKPTSQVTTNNAATGNAWNLAVPTYNASYPHYFYCYQQQKGDGTYQWSDVVYDKGTTEAMQKAQAALPSSTFTTFEQNTFKELVDEVDEQSSTITQMSEKITTTARNLLTATLCPQPGGVRTARGTGEEFRTESKWYTYNAESTLTRTDAGIRIDHAGGASGGITIPLIADDILADGEKLTLSFDYRGNYTALGTLYVLCNPTPNISQGTPTTLDDSGEWAHYEYSWTYKANANAPWAILIEYYNSAGKWLEIRDGSMILERGAMTVTTLTNTVNSVKQTADANTASISGISTVVSNNGLTSTTNITSRASKIEQTLDGFSSTVGAIVDETVTGTNILTGNALNPYNWTISAPTGASYTKTAYGTAGVKVQFSAISGWEWLYSPAITVVSGKKYTLSVEYTVGKDYTITSGKGGFGLSVYKTTPPHSNYDNANTNFVARAQFFETTTRVAMKATVTFTASSNSVYLGLNGGQINDGQSGLSFTLDKLTLVENISSRVSTAETSINQTADAIGLTATGTATIANPNLSPYYSSIPLNTAENEYWRFVSIASGCTITSMGDGWVRMQYTNSTSGAVRAFEVEPVQCPSIVPGDDYTWLAETRNNNSTISSTNTYFYLVQTTGNQFWGGNAKKSLDNGPVSSSNTKLEYPSRRFVKAAEKSSDGHWGGSSSATGGLARWNMNVAAGDTIDCEFRLSLYEGEYTGPYKPYSGSQLYASQAELKVANDAISARVEKNGVIASINASVETSGGSAVKISADKVNIEGAAIFTGSGRLSSTSLNNAYDSKGSAAAVQTNLDNLEIGGTNLLKNSTDLSSWVKSSCTIASGKADPDGGTGAFLMTPSSTGWYISAPITDVCLKNVGEQYTFSIWLRADNATQCGLRGRFISGNYSSTAHRETFNISTDWKRYYITGELLQAQTSDAFWIGQITSEPIYAYHPKVEKGNRPTDWTPAPEDQTAYADGLVDCIIIGGRNLATGTGTHLDFTQTSTPTYFSRTGFYSTSDTGLAMLANTVNKSFIVSFDWAATGVTTAYQLYPSLQNSATTYTAGNITERASVPTGNSSGHFSAVFEPNSGQRQYGGKWLLSRTTNTANTSGTVVLSNFMFEVATKESAWSLAPEDVAFASDSVEYIVGTQTAATGSWTGVTRDKTLVAGKTISYKLPYAGSGNASLQLKDAAGSNVGGNVAVYTNTTRVTTHFGAGAVINMTYDGTYWRANSIPNTNNYDRRLHNNYIKAAGNVTSGALVCGTASGYKQVAASATFDLAYPILWAGAAWTSGSQYANGYEAYPSVNVATTLAVANIPGIAANKTVYVKGTVSGNTFTCASANFLTCTPPSSADGNFYIPVGILANDYTADATSKLYFSSSKDLYAYLDGKFRQVNPTDIVATQKIYYRTSAESNGVATKPNGNGLPTAWVTETGDKWSANATTASNWSTKPTPLANGTGATVTKYPFLWTCEQRKRLDGTVNYTNILLDDTDTVIDGGNIITGSITANKIATGSLSIGYLASAVQTSIGNGDTANSRAVAYRGTCGTAAGTTAKAVTCANFALATGATVECYCSTANTANTPTLNVNSTGAKAIWINGAASSASNPCKWKAGDTVTFTYDGTQFRASLPVENYITADSSGIKIHDATNTTNYQHQTSSGTDIFVGGNKRTSVTSTGLEVFDSDGSTSLAKFGSTMRVGKAAENNVQTSSSGISFYNNSKEIGTLSMRESSSYPKYWAAAYMPDGRPPVNIGVISSSGTNLLTIDTAISQDWTKYVTATAVSSSNTYMFVISAADIAALVPSGGSLSNYYLRVSTFGATASASKFKLYESSTGTLLSATKSPYRQTIVKAANEMLLNANLSVDDFDCKSINGVTIGDLSLVGHTHSAANITSGTLSAARGGTGANGSSVTKNYVLAAPSSAAGAVSYRALVAADIPNLNTSKLTAGTLGVARGGTGKTAGTCYMATVISAFNATGTDGTVDLSETAANFTFIDIFFKGNDGYYDFTRVYSPNGKVANLSTMESTASGNVNCKWKAVTISTTSITNKYYGEMDNGGTPASVNHIKICGVIGYK